jgi:hypothetical protein
VKCEDSQSCVSSSIWREPRIASGSAPNNAVRQRIQE